MLVLMICSSVVAPYVGAWIETSSCINARSSCYYVAPYVGAWIETVDDKNNPLRTSLSHPTWVRGLKPAADVTTAENI